jgi:hypothetical protein
VAFVVEKTPTLAARLLAGPFPLRAAITGASACSGVLPASELIEAVVA